jgi:DNA-binding response OmpR family regulator
MRVLLVEDEINMASALRDALEGLRILLDHAENLALAETMANTYQYDALILDRHLPDGDGLDLITRLREKGNPVPVLVLTALGDLPDRVDGLNKGADDYVGKPFALEELVARLHALVRRPATLHNDIVSAGQLSYDYANHEATVGAATLDLTRREILVLETLLRRLGRMVARATLMEAVFSMDDEVQPNALDTQISRLRRKLVDAEAGLVINGVRGVGYLLRCEQ